MLKCRWAISLDKSESLSFEPPPEASHSERCVFLQQNRTMKSLIFSVASVAAIAMTSYASVLRELSFIKLDTLTFL